MFSDNLINRSFCFLLIVIFLSTCPTSATALTFCLDEQKNHIVGQNFYFSDCHTVNEDAKTFTDEDTSALFEERRSDCKDVSLSTANILYRPSKFIIPTSVKLILFYTFPYVPASFHQRPIEYRSPAFYKELFGLPQINAHRTVVLLI